jgi:hypothetical protein
MDQLVFQKREILDRKLSKLQIKRPLITITEHSFLSITTKKTCVKCIDYIPFWKKNSHPKYSGVQMINTCHCGVVKPLIAVNKWANIFEMDKTTSNFLEVQGKVLCKNKHSAFWVLIKSSLSMCHFSNCT